MARPPRPKAEGLFAHGLALTIAVRGAMLGLASAGAYTAALYMGESLTEARSACFLTIVLSQMLHIFECRGKGLHFGGNRALMAAVSASVLCAVLCVYVPFLQPVFGTQAVWGRALWAVGGAVVAGPVLTSAARRVKRLVRGR